MRFILRLLANAAALGVATFLLSGISLTGSSTGNKVLTLLLVALIFTVWTVSASPVTLILRMSCEPLPAEIATALPPSIW